MLPPNTFESHKGFVLVASDDDVLRRLVVDTLRQVGHHVDETRARALWERPLDGWPRLASGLLVLDLEDPSSGMMYPIADPERLAPERVGQLLLLVDRGWHQRPPRLSRWALSLNKPLDMRALLETVQWMFYDINKAGRKRPLI